MTRQWVATLCAVVAFFVCGHALLDVFDERPASQGEERGR